MSVVAVTFYFNVNTSERRTDLDSNAGSIQHPNISKQRLLLSFNTLTFDVLDSRSDAKGACGKWPKP